MNKIHENSLIILLKQSILNNNILSKVKAENKKTKNIKLTLEENILNLMQDLDISELNMKDPNTEIIFNIHIDKKKKTKTLNKKMITQNCLLYCNGNTEQANTIINFLYDKNARAEIVKECIKYTTKDNI